MRIRAAATILILGRRVHAALRQFDVSNVSNVSRLYLLSGQPLTVIMEISMRDEKSDQMPTKATARRQQRGSRAASNSHPSVEVVARVGTPGQKNWGLLLKFTDHAGHQQSVRLPASRIRNRGRLLEFLDD